MVTMNFPAEGRVLNFLGRGDEACLHCIDSTSLSGSQWWTHVSSPVTVVCHTNLTGSDTKTSTISWDVMTRRAQSWSVRFLGTHLADTFDIFRWSRIMVSMLPHEICIVLAISSTFILLSSLISFSTAATYRRINSIRRPAGPRVIFERLTITPKLIWPSGNCAVRRCTVPIHGKQSIMHLLCFMTFFTEKLNDCTKLKL